MLLDNDWIMITLLENDWIMIMIMTRILILLMVKNIKFCTHFGSIVEAKMDQKSFKNRSQN